MVTSELGACEWFVWDLRRSNLLDRGQLDQIIGEFLGKNPRAEPPALAEFLVGRSILTQFQAERLLAGKTQGFVLGPFVLMDALGSGSMGTVYKSQSKTDNNWFAVKVLPRRSMWNVRLARRKVRAFEQCKHPSIVPFVDVGTSGGMHYLAWPLVEGECLDKKILANGKVRPALAAHYALQIAEGLDVAHKQGLIHGLMKPTNIMVSEDESTVQILDFGIGCLLAETEGESLVDTMSTANSVASGLDCASPESIMEPTNLTPAGDQYSLGCTLYFMLTGQFPFPDGTAAEKMMAHQFKQATPVNELSADVPAGLAEVVNRLLQKTPEQRFGSTTEAVDAIRPFASRGSGLVLRPKLPKTARPLTPRPGGAPVNAQTPSPMSPLRPNGAQNPPTPKAPAPAPRPATTAGLPVRPQTMTAIPQRPATMQSLPTREPQRSAAPPAQAPRRNVVAPPPVDEEVVEFVESAEQMFDEPRRSWSERLGAAGPALVATVVCCAIFGVVRYFKLF